MATGLKEQYFILKKKNINNYVKNATAVFTTSESNVYVKAIAVITIWDLFMMRAFLSNKDVTGCETRKFVQSFNNSMLFKDLIESLHENRNKIAHIADDIEILVGEVADILRSYKYYDVLQRDLDKVFCDTEISISAENIFRVFKVPLNKKYSIDGELPDIGKF